MLDDAVSTNISRWCCPATRAWLLNCTRTPWYSAWSRSHIPTLVDSTIPHAQEDSACWRNWRVCCCSW